MPEPGAEIAYLFRHALLRDAAYQLQMPADRARLHGWVVQIFESFYGGRPDKPQPFSANKEPFVAHALDPIAEELARHATFAGNAVGPNQDNSEQVHRLYLHRAAAFAQSTYQNEAAARLWLELAGLVAGSERGQALQQASEFNRRCGRIPRVKELLHLALAEYRQAGDKQREAHLLRIMAAFPLIAGDLDTAEKELKQVHSLYEALGDRLGLARMKHQFAFLHFERGDMELAAQSLESAIADYRLLGAVEHEADAIGFLANIRGRQGDIAAWEAGHLRALEMSRSSRRPEALANAFCNLANVYADTHRTDRAIEASEQGQAIYRRTGDLRTLGIELAWFANLKLAQGQVKAARAAWQEGAEILRSIGEDKELEQRKPEMRDACAKAGVAPFDN